jgi:hypothetical protein
MSSALEFLTSRPRPLSMILSTDLEILSDYHTANPSHLAPTLNPTFQPLVATPTPPSEDNGSDASPPEGDLESMPSPVESLTGSSRLLPS